MILMTADWHIKIGQKNVPRDWALNRYKLFFDKLRELEKQVELHIIPGDIFDKNPSMEELSIYFDFVRGATVKTLVTAGNHEATKKGETFFTHLKEATNAVNPLVEVIDYVYETDKFILVPYEFIHKKKFWESLDKSKILFSHIRGAIEPHVKPEIDLALISSFPVCYLGDLHSHSNSQANLVYPGSPMVTSFHRNISNDNGYLLIEDIDLTRWTWYPFELPQLLRVTTDDPDSMVSTNYHHTIYELTGDLVDLKSVKNSELLDKKIIKRSSDIALVLNPSMSIEDEVVEYWRYILELPEDKISEGVTKLHDYYTKIKMG